jgi:DNA-binding transcriptional MerR regulator
MVGYKAREAVRIAGIPYQTLNYWAKSGFITPTICEASGVGTERIYSFDDLVALRLASRLVKHGISKRSLTKVVKCLRDANVSQASCMLSGNPRELPVSEGGGQSMDHRPGRILLILDGLDVSVVRGPKTDLLKVYDHTTVGPLTVLNVEPTLREIRQAIACVEDERKKPARSRGLANPEGEEMLPEEDHTSLVKAGLDYS